MKYIGTPESFKRYLDNIHVLHELYTIGEIKSWIQKGDVQICLLGKDRKLVEKLKRRFNIEINIVDNMPDFEITYLDRLLVINYWRSPIIRDPKASRWVTYDECLYETSFSFVVWQLRIGNLDDHPTYSYLQL